MKISEPIESEFSITMDSNFLPSLSEVRNNYVLREGAHSMKLNKCFCVVEFTTCVHSKLKDERNVMSPNGINITKKSSQIGKTKKVNLRGAKSNVSAFYPSNGSSP